MREREAVDDDAVARRVKSGWRDPLDLEERSRRAAVRMAESATERGLADVAYGTAESPFGPLLVAVSRRGVVRIEYPDRSVDETLEEVAREVSARVLGSARATETVRRELEEYFQGRRRRFTVPVDLSTVRGFDRRVLSGTAEIPYGAVATYREMAGRAGSPRGARAAGNALAKNPVPIMVPCHRVVASGGGLGGYTGGLHRKVELLRLEGVLEGE